VKLYVGDYNLSSWSLRPWLVLKVAGAEFDTEVVRLDQPNSRAELLAVSPTGKVPVLHHGPVVIWESLAIAEYVAERFPTAHLWPEDPAVRAVARAAACEMHAGFANLRSQHPMNVTARIERPPSPEVQREVERLTALWRDLRLRFGDGGRYLFGRWSIADAMFTPVATRLRTYGIPVHADVRAYAEALLEHPAFRDWEELARTEVGAG
jgi:glutathione S-transferase